VLPNQKKMFIKKLYCTFLFLVFGFGLNVLTGQQQYIDSIKNLLTQKMDDETRLDNYFKLAKSYRNVNAYIGLDYIDSSLTLVDFSETPQLKAEIMNEAGVLYRKLGLYQEALDENQKALVKFEALNDSMGIAYCYANMGNVFLTIGKFDLALEYNLKSLKIKKFLGDSLQVAYSLRTTAIAFQMQKKYDSAIVYFKNALDIYKAIGSEYGQANMYFHIGSVKLESGINQQLSLDYFQKALILYNKLQNSYGTAVANYEVGIVNLQLGDLDRAEMFFDYALAMAQKAKNPRISMDIYLDLSELNVQRANFKDALKYHQKYSKIRDSLYSESFTKNLAEMQAKYKRDAEIVKLRNENNTMKKEEQLKTAYLILLIFGIVFSLGMLVLLFWRYWEKKKSNLLLENENLIRKTNERKLLESEKKLMEANATKDKFFSIISHDLKSPFGAMKGLIEMLGMNYKSFNESEKLELISVIGKASNNTYTLLEDLLTWSQAQRGTMDFNPVKTDLAENCKNTIECILPFARKKQISIINNVSEGNLVKADINMLTTIIRNILSNAVKFTPNGGEIYISAKKPEGSLLEISIADNGVGMSEQQLQKIFKIDEKYKTQGTNNETGTGLGLMICKEFVEKHQGEINVVSKEGIGSTFSFTLPAV